MLLCQQHGHDIVALGNLLPSDSNQDDIDSYMYQTVRPADSTLACNPAAGAAIVNLPGVL
jgi:diphthamide synthase (EF-2-diphthine--ammonia ligase)